MMIKKSLLLFLLLISPMKLFTTFPNETIINNSQTIQHKENAQQQTKKGGWQYLTKNIASTLIIGSLIGSIYGGSCAYLEREGPRWISFIWPVNWLIFMTMKHASLETILLDAKKHNIDCHRATLYNSAWISDWLSYLYCRNITWQK